MRIESFRYEGIIRHQDAWRVKPKKLSWVTEFSIRTELPLLMHFLAHIAFFRQLDFQPRNVRFCSYLWRRCRNAWRKLSSKTGIKNQPDAKHESYVRRYFFALVSHAGIQEISLQRLVAQTFPSSMQEKFCSHIGREYPFLWLSDIFLSQPACLILG